MRVHAFDTFTISINSLESVFGKWKYDIEYYFRQTLNVIT